MGRRAERRRHRDAALCPGGGDGTAHPSRTATLSHLPGRPFMRVLTLVLTLVLLVGGPVQSADAPSDFFNGKDLSGWQGLEKYWKVENGAIVGGSDDKIPFNTFLCSKKKYKDF